MNLIKCKQCGKIFEPRRLKTEFCSKPCSRLYLRKVERPSKEKLEKLVWAVPTTTIARYYGVSDKSISKWCLQYGIGKPSRGYWKKLRAK